MKAEEKNISFGGENTSDVSVSPSDEDRKNGVNGAEHYSDQSGIPRKRKRRRIKGGGRHHKKWKPYDKLTWPEKKALEDKETIRATQKREEAFASGHPVAPYNTTQFLMEDHIQSEASPDLLDVENGENINSSLRDSFHSDADGSSDLEYGADEDETFLAKEFSEAYDNIHAERLQTMSKEQLVKDYVELERKVETLEKKLKDSNQNKRLRADENSDGTSLSSSGEELQDLAALKNVGEEMKRLREDNIKMKEQIEELKKKNGGF
ncbi:hypothetical protein LOTGIDRAFT_128589 [Lottia gigantea]|uniref:HEXIM P-TEFb complex subunit 1 n=1 Tax=Lottia gigantea TaxID=225164 RepID=V4A0Q6_LOTGI|nr:hypothetical protein LOTGIDRAFT_128589 [Lottia gigantea]ESO86836.1 hypothetical protein LOTGIDRAFT_128589 [Lottia gigantea]